MALEEIEIEGYLGGDPSKPSPQNYPNLVNFSVGVTQSIKNKQTNEWDSKTTWYKVSSWQENKTDYLYQNLKKGDKIVVKGRPSIELWQGKDGQQKATISINLQKIVMMKKRDDSNDVNSVNQSTTSAKNVVLDDEIPF